MSQDIIEGVTGQQPCGVFDYAILACFLVGAYRLLRFLFAVVGPYLGRRLDLQKRYNGGWALITGGSEGIGLSIAEELAKQNFNIILISRSVPKLQSAREKLKKINPNIEIVIKSVDFEKITSEEQYLQAFNEFLQRDVSILVNNVGYYVPHKFTELTFEEVRREMKINCLPIAVLSRIFIEKMAKRVSRSGIINLSSGASLANFSGCVHYSATKKFDDYLSLTLAEEFREKIDVLTVRPFMVTTPMTRNTDSIMHTPSSKCAKDIVNSLGNRDTCYGSLNHTLQGEVTFELHSSALTAAFSKTMKDFRPIFDKAGQ